MSEVSRESEKQPESRPGPASPAPTEASLGKRIRQHLARNAERYWAPLLYCIAVYYLYREVFAGERGFGWDTTETYWPDLVFFAESLADGEWPLWNPFDRGGYPFSSDPQPGMFYPLHWLLALVGTAFGDTGWGLIQFKMLLHHAIAGLCMHVFLRHLGLSRVAAVVGGLAVVASTPFLIHKASNLLMPMVWTPLVWLATDALFRRPTWRRALGLAASLYVAGSAGSPPGFFYVLVMALFYGGYRFVQAAAVHYRGGELASFVKKVAPLLGLAAAVVFALLWVSVAPGLELAKHTPRVTRDLNYALSLPLPMWPTLSALVVPTSGQVDAYCGILVLVLGITAIALRPKQFGGAPIFFFAVSLLFLSMSFGAELPVLEFFVEKVPGFGLFRISSRYKCLFALTWAPMAAFGVAALADAKPRFSRDTWIALGVCAAALLGVLALLHSYPLDPKLVKRFPGAKTPLVLTGLAISLVAASALHARRVRIFLFGAMALVVLGDPERYWHHQRLFLEAKVDHKEDLQKISDLPGVADHTLRIYDEFHLEQRPGSRLRIRDFRGYPSGDPLDFQRYQEVLRRAGKAPELLEAYNVGYILHGRHHRNAKRSHRLKQDPARNPHFERQEGPVRRAKHPAPLVAWYGGIRIVPKKDVLTEVLALEGQDGTRTRAILEPEDASHIPTEVRAELEASPGAFAQGSLRSFGTDRVDVTIDAPNTGVVVLNEVYYPGWKATVDGKEVPTFRANYLLRAVVVAPGTHTITWRYEPPGHSARMLLYLLGMLALLSAAVPWERFLSRLRRS